MVPFWHLRLAFSRLSDSRNDAKVLGTRKYEHVIWEKGAVSPQFPPVLFSCSLFLNFADPTISEPGTGYLRLDWNLKEK